MCHFRKKISILVVLFGLCSGAFSAASQNVVSLAIKDGASQLSAEHNDSSALLAAGFMDWGIKRYAPDPSQTYKLVSLEKDYFADHVEAQAEILMRLSKKLRAISSTSSANNYKDYLSRVASFLGALHPYLGAPLEGLLIKVNMMRQFAESSNSWGYLLEEKKAGHA